MRTLLLSALVAIMVLGLSGCTGNISKQLDLISKNAINKSSTVKKDTMNESTIKNKAMNEGTMKNDTMSEGTSMNDTMDEGAMKKDTMK